MKHIISCTCMIVGLALTRSAIRHTWCYESSTTVNRLYMDHLWIVTNGLPSVTLYTDEMGGSV